MRKKQLTIMVLVVFALGLMSCAGGSFLKNSYRTLSTAAVTYDVAMKSAADLYFAGDLSEADKTKIIKVATKYRTAYILAKRAVAGYEAVRTVESKDKAAKALGEFLKFSDELMGLLSRLVKGV